MGSSWDRVWNRYVGRMRSWSVPFANAVIAARLVAEASDNEENNRG